MELLAGIAVLLALVFCLTGQWSAVVIAAAGIAVLFVFLLFGFFLFFLFRVARFEKRTGQFLRIEKNEKKKFETAVYQVDDAEYTDIFPAEPIFRKYLYRENVPVKLRLRKARQEVCDRNTLITVLAGTAGFGLSTAGAVFFLIRIFL